MCGGGKGSTTGSQSTNQNVAYNPYGLPLFQQIYNQAAAAASQPYQAYSGQLVAPWNGAQTVALQGIEGAQGMAQPYYATGAGMIGSGYGNQSYGANIAAGGLPYINQGAGMIGQGANVTQGALPYLGQGANLQQYGANTAGNALNYFGAGSGLMQTGAGRIWDAGNPITGSQIGQYLNPYQKSVTDATIANINETNAQQQQQVMGNAAMRGALGGDRLGVAQAELARQQGLASNQTLAGLNQQNYNTALQTALSQQQAGMQSGAQFGNIGQNIAGLGGQQAGVGFGLGGLGTQMAGLGGLQANIGQGLAGMGGQYANLAGLQSGIGGNIAGIGSQQVGAGSAYGNLGTQAQNEMMQGYLAQFGLGSQLQNTEQAGLTAQYQQYLQQLAYPYQQAQFLAGIGLPAAGAMGGQQYQTGLTNQIMTPPQVSLLQAGLGLGSLGYGIYGGATQGGTTQTARGGRINPYSSGGIVPAYPLPLDEDTGHPIPMAGGGSSPYGDFNDNFVFGDTNPWDAKAVNFMGGMPGEIKMPDSMPKPLPNPQMMQAPQQQQGPLGALGSVGSVMNAGKGLAGIGKSLSGLFGSGSTAAGDAAAAAGWGGIGGGGVDATLAAAAIPTTYAEAATAGGLEAALAGGAEAAGAGAAGLLGGLGGELAAALPFLFLLKKGGRVPAFPSYQDGGPTDIADDDFGDIQVDRSSEETGNPFHRELDQNQIIQAAKSYWGDKLSGAGNSIYNALGPATRATQAEAAPSIEPKATSDRLPSPGATPATVTADNGVYRRPVPTERILPPLATAAPPQPEPQQQTKITVRPPAPPQGDQPNPYAPVRVAQRFDPATASDADIMDQNLMRQTLMKRPALRQLAKDPDFWIKMGLNILAAKPGAGKLGGLQSAAEGASETVKGFDQLFKDDMTMTQKVQTLAAHLKENAEKYTKMPLYQKEHLDIERERLSQGKYTPVEYIPEGGGEPQVGSYDGKTGKIYDPDTQKPVKAQKIIRTIGRSSGVITENQIQQLAIRAAALPENAGKPYSQILAEIRASVGQPAAGTEKGSGPENPDVDPGEGKRIKGKWYIGPSGQAQRWLG